MIPALKVNDKTFTLGNQYYVALSLKIAFLKKQQNLLII